MSYANYDRTVTKSPINSRISYNQKEDLSQVRMMKDYSNYSKDELKVAMKAISKAGKSLRAGSMEVSMLQERQSMIRNNGR